MEKFDVAYMQRLFAEHRSESKSTSEGLLFDCVGEPCWAEATQYQFKEVNEIAVPLGAKVGEFYYKECLGSETAIVPYQKVIAVQSSLAGGGGLFVLTLIPRPAYGAAYPDYGAKYGVSVAEFDFSGYALLARMDGTPVVGYHYCEGIFIAYVDFSVGMPLSVAQSKAHAEIKEVNVDAIVVVGNKYGYDEYIYIGGGRGPSSGGGSGGGGGGGGSSDRNYSGGGGGRGNLHDEAWSEGLHNVIISDAFASLSSVLTPSQIASVKAGSKNADAWTYQGAEYGYMHFLRRSTQTKQQAMVLLKDYFVSNVSVFKTLDNYLYLGMALHPIMDAYAPAHERMQTYDGLFDLWKHRNDGKQDSFKMQLALHAILNVYNEIQSGKNPEAIFDTWIQNYEKEMGD